MSEEDENISAEARVMFAGLGRSWFEDQASNLYAKQLAFTHDDDGGIGAGILWGILMTPVSTDPEALARCIETTPELDPSQAGFCEFQAVERFLSRDDIAAGGVNHAARELLSWAARDRLANDGDITKTVLDIGPHSELMGVGLSLVECDSVGYRWMSLYALDAFFNGFVWRAGMTGPITGMSEADEDVTVPDDAPVLSAAVLNGTTHPYFEILAQLLATFRATFGTLQDKYKADLAAAVEALAAGQIGAFTAGNVTVMIGGPIDG